mgnify:CR=1 FL=1
MGRTEETGWKSRVTDKSSIQATLARVRERLADLDDERCELQREMEALEARLASEPSPAVKQPAFENATITSASPSHEKVDLFRRLFAGRPEVFPLRWKNRKTGRSLTLSKSPVTGSHRHPRRGTGVQGSVNDALPAGV